MNNYTNQRMSYPMWNSRRYCTTDRWSNSDGSNPIRSNAEFPMCRSKQWEVPMQWTNEYQDNRWSVRPMKNQWWSLKTNEEPMVKIETSQEPMVKCSMDIHVGLYKYEWINYGRHPGTRYGGIRTYLKISGVNTITAIFTMIGPNSLFGQTTFSTSAWHIFT